MDCHRVRETMFLVSDNELEQDLLASFEDHLAHCGDCAAYFEYVTKFLAVVRERCCRYAAPSRLRSRILDSLPHHGPTAPRVTN